MTQQGTTRKLALAGVLTALAAAGIMVAAGIMMAVKNRHTDLVEIRSVAAADRLSRAAAEHPAILSGFAAISRLHM